MPSNTDLGFNVFATDKAGKTFLKLAENVDRLGRKLDELDRKKAEPKVDVDTRRARRQIDDLEQRLNKLSFRKVVVGTAVALAPGALGAGAGLGAVAALGAGAGAGVAAFGATAAASLARVTEAREKLAEADANHARIMARLSRAQEQAVRDLNQLERAFRSFQDTTDPAVLAALGSGMSALESTMPALVPLVERSSGAFDQLFTTIDGLVSQPGFHGWVEDMSDLAGDTLPRLGTASIHAAQGIGNILTAFGGLGRGTAGGIAGLMEDFAAWTQGPGLRELVAFAEQTGPQLVDTLGATTSAVANLAEAAGPLASPLLAIAEAGANIVNTLSEVHPGLLTAVVAVGSFTAAAKSLGSGLVTTNARMKAFGAHIATIPTRTGKAGAAMSHMAASLGGRGGIAAAAGFSTLALSGMADQSTVTGAMLSTFSQTASGALLGFAAGGPIGAAIGGGIGLLTGLGTAFLASGDDAQQAADDTQVYLGTLNKVSGAVTKTTRELVTQRLEAAGALRQLSNFGLDPGLGVAAVLGDEAAIRAITSAFDEQIASIERRQELLRSSPEDPLTTQKELNKLDGLNARHLELTRRKEALLTLLGVETEQLNKDRKAFQRTSDAVDGYGNSQQRAAGKVRTLTQRVRAATRAQREQAQQALIASDNNLAFGQAMLDAAKEAKRGKTAWDQVTQAGIDNRSAVNRAIAAWNNLGAAQQNTGRRFENTRQRLIDMAVQMGASRKEARRYIDRLMEVPKRVHTEAALDKSRAERNASILKEKFNEIPDPKNTAHFDTRGAINAARSMARTIGGILGGIPNETVNVELSGLAKLALKGSGPLMRAGGGRITGPGGPRDDVIPALLSNGEYVIDAATVDKAGGFSFFDALRRAIRRGEAGKGDLPAFAAGGSVSVRPQMSKSGFASAANAIEAAFSGVVDRIGSRLSDKINEMYRFGGGRPLGTGGSLSKGQVFMGQRFAQAQAGKPYIWGGVGPAGYDCSGFVGAVLNAALGRNPYSRLGSTATMPWAGFTRGLGTFSAGWFTGAPGHMAGNIGGLGIESAGGVGVRLGGAATKVTSFPNVAKYDSGGIWPNNTIGVNTSGGPELVINPRKLAKGGRVTKREEREIVRALRGFRVGEHSTRRDVRSEIHDLVRTLKETLGRKSPIIDRVRRLGDRMEDVGGHLAKLNKRAERLDRREERLRSNRQRLAGSVRDQFRNDPFGGSLAELSLQLRADRNDARRMNRALHRAEAKGLSGGLFTQLAQSGNFLLAQQFASSSRREIRHLERLFAQRNAASSRLGNFVGGEQFGDELRANRQAQRDNTRATRRQTRVMDKRARHLERAVEKGVRAGMRQGGARQRARTR